MKTSLIYAAALLCGLAAMTVSATGYAQTVDAAAYVPAPAGTRIVMAYGQYGHAGSRYANGEKTDGDVDISRYTAIARYIRYGEIGGRTYNLQILQPFGHAEADGATAALGDATGLGDTIVTAQLFLHEDRQTRTFFGIQPYLFLPTGDHDGRRGLNIGENRWKASIQAGGSRALGAHVVVEAVADAMIFGDNDDVSGGRRLETEPLYRVQLFGRYVFNPEHEGSLRLVYSDGGQTSLDGVERDDKTGTTSALATWRYNFSPGLNLLSQVGTDLSVRNGLREDARVQVRLTRVF